MDEDKPELPSFDNNNNTESIVNKYKKKNLKKDKNALSSLTNQLIDDSKKSTFKDMGVSNSTIQDLTKVIEDSTNCDADCRERRQLNNSRDALLLAIQILNGAPSYFDLSQKNFLITQKGKAGYVQYIVDNANKIIDNFIKNQEELNESLQEMVKNMILNYSYNVQYLESINNTLKNSKNDLTDVDNKISKYTNLVNLDKRTNYFESENISRLRNYNYYITIIYYISLFFILIFKNFKNNFIFSRNIFENFNLTNLIFLIILLILVFLPLILKILIIISIRFYEKFLQIMNIQKFPQSYREIIMEDR